MKKNTKAINNLKTIKAVKEIVLIRRPQTTMAQAYHVAARWVRIYGK